VASFSFDRINKIVTVLAPDTQVSVQELYDACRDYEDEPRNLDLDKIVDGAGKQELGGGVKVGITITLLGWKVTFEGRAGPDWTLCEISGGNLVGYDSQTAQFYVPIEPSSYTTIVRTSSSSATLQELEALQYSSFNGGVWIDAINGQSGTEYPIGTPEYPVDNVPDAITIATTKGFLTLFVIGDLTIPNTANIDNFTVVGESIRTVILVQAGATTNETSFRKATITGTLTGHYVDICDGKVISLAGFCGYMHNVMISGLITLATGTDLIQLDDCFAGSDGFANTPTINMNGGDANINVTHYSGQLIIANIPIGKTPVVRVNLDAGELFIDASVGGGFFYVRGVGRVSGGGSPFYLDTESLVNPEEIANKVWDEQLSAHITPGSAGEIVARLLGISGERTQWSNIVLDGNGNMTSAQITAYYDNAFTQEIATWEITATYDGSGNLLTYKMEVV